MHWISPASTISSMLVHNVGKVPGGSSSRRPLRMAVKRSGRGKARRRETAGNAPIGPPSSGHAETTSSPSHGQGQDSRTAAASGLCCDEAPDRPALLSDQHAAPALWQSRSTLGRTRCAGTARLGWWWCAAACRVTDGRRAEVVLPAEPSTTRVGPQPVRTICRGRGVRTHSSPGKLWESRITECGSR